MFCSEVLRFLSKFSLYYVHVTWLIFSNHACNLPPGTPAEPDDDMGLPRVDLTPLSSLAELYCDDGDVIFPEFPYKPPTFPRRAE